MTDFGEGNSWLEIELLLMIPLNFFSDFKYREGVFKIRHITSTMFLTVIADGSNEVKLDSDGSLW